MPTEAILTLIQALALHRQGRAGDAGALVAALNPGALKEPRTALYYGVFLTVSGRRSEAEEILRLAGTASLLMEEKTLMGRAREAMEGRAK